MFKIQNNTYAYFITFVIALFLLTISICFVESINNGLSFIVFTSLSLFILSSFKYGFYGIYYVLIILIPFSQSITLFTLLGRPVNLGMHTMTIGWIILLTLFKQQFKIKLINQNFLVLMFCLTLLTFASLFINILNISGSALSNSIITWIRWVQFFPIAYFIVTDNNISKYFNSFINLFLVIALIIAIWGIWEILNPTEFSIKAFRGAVTFTKPIFRETDTSKAFQNGGYYLGSANYNIAGAYMTVSTLLLLPFLISYKYIKSKFITFGAITLLIIGIAVTQSRSSILAFIVALIFYYKEISLRKLLLIIFIICACFLILFIYFPDRWLIPMIKETITKFPEALYYALQDKPYNQTMGFSVNVYGAAMRIVGIKEALLGFLNYPFFGGGFFTFSFYNKLGTAENFFFQFLFETGITGITLFIILLKIVWKTTKLKHIANSFAGYYQKGFRSAFIGFIMVNLSGTLFYDTRIWGLFIILSAIQVKLYINTKKKSTNENIIFNA
jgi:hypothetical protein